MRIDHAGIVVPADKVDDVVKFLIASLGHMGFKEIMRPIPTAVGMGDAGPWFWVQGCDMDEATGKAISKKQHTAFTADNAEQVQQFHAAALKAGATDNGAPGPRSYHPGYYSAFVRDPVCGINFEVAIRNHQG
ncbi:hypothetical protein V8E51_006477 [Hyaloscypha variabilis]